MSEPYVDKIESIEKHAMYDVALKQVNANLAKSQMDLEITHEIRKFLTVRVKELSRNIPVTVKVEQPQAEVQEDGVKVS